MCFYASRANKACVGILYPEHDMPFREYARPTSHWCFSSSAVYSMLYIPYIPPTRMYEYMAAMASYTSHTLPISVLDVPATAILHL